jgi:glyoxylase-like metal-dependent hydrolase (beta-lactamase superfamily II)
VKRIAPCLLLATIAATTATRADPTITATTTPWPRTEKIEGVEILHVQKNVYMLAGAGANVTVQLGDEGPFLVDAGGIGQGARVLAAVQRLSPKPIRYIVNTSADADHAGGDSALVEASGGPRGLGGRSRNELNAGVMVTAHQNAVDRLQAGTPAFPALGGEGLPRSSVLKLAKKFYPNGEAVVATFLPAAHTDGDLMVFFRGSDVISTGDVFRTDSYPVIDPARGGTIAGELDALNDILDLVVAERNEMGGTRVIPGHGRLCNESEVIEYRNMLTIIRDRIKEMLGRKLTLAQVRAAHPTLEYDTVYGRGPEMTGDRLIEVIYNELRGPQRH